MDDPGKWHAERRLAALSGGPPPSRFQAEPVLAATACDDALPGGRVPCFVRRSPTGAPDMSKLLPPYLAIVATMMVLDVIWIGGIARPLYNKGIGHLMADQPNFVAAVVFYLLFGIGLMAFVVLPRAAGDWRMAAAWGALFGFMTYMTWCTYKISVGYKSEARFAT
jgi:uncharacterized membrane protein